MEIEIGTQETPVVQKTRELCETIVQQDQFPEILARIERFLADSEAQALYQNLTEVHEKLVSQQEQGDELSADEISAYERQREAVFANEVAGGFVAARQDMHTVQETVMRYVGLTFELGRVPTEEDLQGCGSGGCDSCSSGCG